MDGFFKSKEDHYDVFSVRGTYIYVSTKEKVERGAWSIHLCASNF